MPQNTILQFHQVQKNFAEKKVLNDVSFSIGKGEIIALLGVNGAGKTTTIKMMLGQEVPSAGRVELFGMNPQNYLSRNRVGCTPQNIEFPEGAKTREILQFVQSHYASPFTISQMTESFELDSFLDQKASRLSGGQKRRLALASAFIGNPELVFLDEPTTGLDVGARKLLWNFVKKEVQAGKTIFLTTHYLEEIEQVATRVIFLQHGSIKIDGTVEEIKKVASSSLVKVSFVFTDEFDFRLLPSCEKFWREEEKIVIESFDADNLLRELVQNQISFKNLNIERENLESAFLNLSAEK